MVSIKDLMDVDDIEPLEAQAHRRSRQAQQEALLQQQQQQQQLFQNQPATQGQSEKSNSTARTPPQIDGPSAPTPSHSLPKRRRSDRVSKHSGASHSRPSSASARRRSSAATTDSMDGMNYGQLQPADMRSPGIPGASASGSMRQTSSGAEGSSQPQVRYTPVTGRVSRARKGQPVHVCDRCNPPRVFTRAEHLRRHALGHDKPRYQCDFSGCEKSFHRQDLLVRHKSRHDAGEIMDKERDGRSRSFSDSDDSQTPPFKVKSSLEIDTSAASGSGSASAYTSQPSGSTSGTLTGTTSSYQNMDTIFGGSNDGSGNRNAYGAPGAGNVMSRGAAVSDFGSTPSIADNFPNINQPLSSHSLAISNPLGMGNPGQSVSQFGYQNSTGTYFNPLGSGLSTPPELLLEIPEDGSHGYHRHHDSGNQNLTYSSDFGSSDDTCSTTPSDASRFGSAYPRERQLSVSDASNSGADWVNAIEWPSSHIVQRRLQTPRLGEGQLGPDGMAWNGRFASPPWLSPNMQQPGFGRGTPSPVGQFQMNSPRRPYTNPPHDDNEDMSWVI